MEVLITCPPMLRSMPLYRHLFAERGLVPVTPEVTQIVPEQELIGLVPRYDGWIIGDDPATGAVFEAGVAGRLKAAVKWGVGVDNVDFAACQRLGLPISNTPGMFGREVADVAIGYMVALARETFSIHRHVSNGEWVKPAGISLAEKTVALVGFGDIGRNVARRLLAMEMKVIAYDPFYKSSPGLEMVQSAAWPDRLDEADFVVFTCALTPENHHMLNAAMLDRAKPGLRVVNVARGPLIEESALVDALKSGRVHSAALDVFETEPLPSKSGLRHFGDRCIFGSHNGSNTVEAVIRTSEQAITMLHSFLTAAPAAKNP